VTSPFHFYNSENKAQGRRERKGDWRKRGKGGGETLPLRLYGVAGSTLKGGKRK